MDAGFAAVVAGAFGAGGAALGAFGASFGLIRQTKLQGAQAHSQWVRDARQKAFAEIIVASLDLEKVVNDALRAAEWERTSGVSASDAVSLVSVQIRHVRLVCNRALILCDGGTGDALLDLLQTSSQFVSASMDVASETIDSADDPPSMGAAEEKKAKYDDAHVRFVGRVRRILLTV